MINTPWNFEPRASVILEVSAESNGLRRTLDAIAAQTTDPRRFELLVVDVRIAVGRGSSTRALVASFRKQCPGVNVRFVGAPIPNRGVGLNLALRAAQYEYVTFIRSGDSVAPCYLQELLLRSSDRYVVQAPVDECGADPNGGHSSGLSEGLAARSGVTAFWNDVPFVLESNCGKLVPTEAARRVGWNELGSLPDSSFWYAFALEETGVTCRFLPSTSDAVYVCHPSEYVAADLYEAKAVPALRAYSLLAAYLDQPGVDHALVRQGLTSLRETVIEFAVRHPSYHLRLSADLRILECEDAFHLDELHKQGAEMLVVAFRFPPVRDTSANVVARRICAWQRPVDVIAGTPGAGDTSDPSTERLVAPYVRRRAVVNAPTWFADWGSWRAFAESGISIVRDWERARGAPYPQVYSRAMWAQSHLLAAMLKVRSPQTIWHAEFSDPLAYGVDGNLREPDLVSDDLIVGLTAAASASAEWEISEGLKLFQWLEYITFSLADKISFTNENQREFMLRRLNVPRLAERIRHISTISQHPNPPREAYGWSTSDSPFDPSKVNIGYFGNFYPTRGLTEITTAIQALNADERSVLRLHVFTANPTALQAEWDAAGLGDVVTARSFIDYADMLKRTTELDCLLVNDAATRGSMETNPYLPSKVSDYRGSGRPIWAIVEPGSAMSSMPMTHQTKLGDAVGATAVLRRLVRNTVAAAAVAKPYFAG